MKASKRHFGHSAMLHKMLLRLFLYSLKTWGRSSHRRCSIKNAVHKNFPVFTRKHLYWSLFFKKIEADLSKKRLWLCFLVNFAKSLRTSISAKNCCFWGEKKRETWALKNPKKNLGPLSFTINTLMVVWEGIDYQEAFPGLSQTSTMESFETKFHS